MSCRRSYIERPHKRQSISVKSSKIAAPINEYCIELDPRFTSSMNVPSKMASPSTENESFEKAQGSSKLDSINEWVDQGIINKTEIKLIHQANKGISVPII